MKIPGKLMLVVALGGLFFAGGALAEEKKAEVPGKVAPEKEAKPAEDPEKVMKRKFGALVRKAEDIKRSKDRASQYTGRQKQTMEAETKRVIEVWYKDYDRAEKKINTALEKAEAVAKTAEDKLAALTAKRTEQNAGTIDSQIAMAKKNAEKLRKDVEVLQADFDLLKDVSRLVQGKK